jgi:hypothetical protein
MNGIAILKIAEGDDGWRDGAPLSVPSDAVWHDMMIYRRLTCAVCRKRGMKAVPQHNGERYRVLCSCRTCRHVEPC